MKDLLKYNCDNCPNLRISDISDSCPNEEMCGVTGCSLFAPQKTWVWVHGCVLHPNVTAFDKRIADVIEKLEEQIGCSKMLNEDGDNYEAYKQFDELAKQIITLLRGE